MNETTPKKRKVPDTRQRQRTPHKLEFIYERVYGEKPKQSHRAEDDVLSLLLVAVASPREFLHQVDDTSMPFEIVKKKW